MNEQETLEGNELIAEFMGCLCEGDFYKEGDSNPYAGEMEYHSSWDWLMPVYFKAKLEIKSIQKGNIVYHNGVNLICDAAKLILEGDMLSAHKKIVEAIKWNNSQNII